MGGNFQYLKVNNTLTVAVYATVITEDGKVYQVPNNRVEPGMLENLAFTSTLKVRV